MRPQHVAHLKALRGVEDLKLTVEARTSLLNYLSVQFHRAFLMQADIFYAGF